MKRVPYLLVCLAKTAGYQILLMPVLATSISPSGHSILCKLIQCYHTQFVIYGHSGEEIVRLMPACSGSMAPVWLDNIHPYPQLCSHAERPSIGAWTYTSAKTLLALYGVCHHGTVPNSGWLQLLCYCAGVLCSRMGCAKKCFALQAEQSP